MDIAVTVVTVCVVLFFVAVIFSNIPWARMWGSKDKTVGGGDEEEEEDTETEEVGADVRAKQKAE